jgi:PAS domain S-box-containing protein
MNAFITAANVAGALALLGAFALLVAKGKHLPAPVRSLLGAVTLVMLAVLIGNVLEWSDLWRAADVAENLILPLVPTLWLFLLVIAVERQDLDRLAESEARYRALVENEEFAVTATGGPDRRIVFWNRGAERLTGWAADEVVGRPIEFIIPEERRSGIQGEIRADLLARGFWSGEYSIVRKDGSIVTAFLAVSRVGDAAQRFFRTVGISINITEQVRLREQLLQAQKMETVGVLAGGIAHDFNNLLTGILGFADILLMALAPASQDHEAARQIKEAARRGCELVRQLMSFSHKQPTRKVPVGLNGVVREVEALAARTFGPAIEIQTCLQPDLPLIEADPTQMHQVLMNLAVNARDAMPDGGTLTFATASADLQADTPEALGLEEGPYVRLTVADTGAGIHDEAKPHIFEPFFTTKPAGAGTGLGLSTVFAIVRRHRGRITFESESGKGTTFTVLLPVQATEQGANIGQGSGNAER